MINNNRIGHEIPANDTESLWKNRKKSGKGALAREYKYDILVRH